MNMTDKTDTTRDIATRTLCLEFAIKSGCGQYFTEEGRSLICDVQIVEAAKKFEEYIKGSQSETKKE